MREMIDQDDMQIIWSKMSVIEKVRTGLGTIAATVSPRLAKALYPEKLVLYWQGRELEQIIETAEGTMEER